MEEDGSSAERETSPANIVALKSQACTVRDQILAEERASQDDKACLANLLLRCAYVVQNKSMGDEDRPNCANKKPFFKLFLKCL